MTAFDGRKYHDELPATWDNAQFVAENLGNIEPKPGMPEGFKQNAELKEAITKAFTEIKNECRRYWKSDVQSIQG